MVESQSPPISIPDSVNISRRRTNPVRMSSFESHYNSFHDIRADIKSKFDSIDAAITSLLSLSNDHEIKNLATTTSTNIVDAQCIVSKYDISVSELQSSIEAMDNVENKESEQQHFDQLMEENSTDGRGLPTQPVRIKSMIRDKKIRYDFAFTESIDRINKCKSLSNCLAPAPVISHPQQAGLPTGGSPAHVPSITPPDLTGSGDSTVASSIDESSVIGQLSNSISQIITHISSSANRPNLSLPPIKLETFDGSDLTRWPAFRYQIDQLVLKQSSLSEVEKAYHLRSSLKGSAFNLVASIPVHENFLDKIVSRLDSQYARHNLTQAKLIQSLRKIRSKSLRVTDQLAAVQLMISIAHSIHSESGVDALYVQQMLAESINPRFITLIGSHKPKTLLKGLELIENQLLTEHEEALTISAYSTGEDTRSIHSHDSPNNRSHRVSNPPHENHPLSSPPFKS